MIRKRVPWRIWWEELEARETPAVTFDLALSIGSTGVYEEGRAVTTDAAGNIYLAGTFGFFGATVDFDPGPGTVNLTAASLGDAFVAKYSPAGALIWVSDVARITGGGGSDAYGVAVDAAGNVYVTGQFGASCDFDPGPGTLIRTSVGTSNIFVSKLDSNGNLLWADAMTGGNSCRGQDVGVDAAGNVYVSGFFDSTTTDFDPGPGTFTFAAASSYEAFFLKLDSSGNFLWADAFVNSRALSGSGIAVDAAGNVYGTASFGGTVDFDPGPGTANLTAVGLYDAFVIKLDTTGGFVWADKLGSSSFAGGIAIDAAGYVYSTGHFIGASSDFDPSASVFPLVSAGGYDIYVSKLDNAGNFVWARRMGGTDYDYGNGLTIGPVGNVVVTGFFGGVSGIPADFDPGPGSFILTSAGAQDIFVAQLDATGTFGWAAGMGSSQHDEGFRVAVDSTGRAFAAGFFRAIADFDPGPPIFNLTSAGNIDAFLVGVTGYQVSVVPSGASTTVIEGGTTDTYTVLLTSQPTANVIVTLSPNSQLAAAPATLTFTPANWSTPQTVIVTAVNDVAVEGNHSGVISHTVSSADLNYNGIATPSLTAAITDNDGGGVTITPSGGTTDVSEGGATDAYTIVLTSAPTANIIITLNPGSQLTALPGLLTFTPVNWNIAQPVTVTAVDDATYEGTHSAVITHTAGSVDPNYNGLGIAGLTATISDNEPPPEMTLAESGGSTSVAEGGGGDSFTAVLTLPPTANVVVTFSGGGQLSAAPANITFTPLNWNVAQSVSVLAVNDLVAEGAHSGVITPSLTSADPLYNGLVVANLTAAIADNDTAGVTITPSGGSTDVGEGGPSDMYSVVLLSQPTANVAVTVSPGSQLSATPTVLTFTPANWNVAQVVTLSAVNDAVYQGTRTVTVAHTAGSVDALYNASAIASLTVNISDKDPPPSVIITQPVGGLALLEGSSQSCTVVLGTQPAADVFVTLLPDAQVATLPAALTYTPANWNIPQPLLVTAVDDGLINGVHAGIIGGFAASADAAYNGIGTASVTAQIIDNDGPAVTGTERNDQIAISFSSGQVLVNVNGKTTTLPGTLSQFLLDAGGGNDSILVTSPTIPLIIFGGAGTDKLIVTGATTASVLALASSSVGVNGVDVGFSGMESLIVSGRTANDTFTIQDVPNVAVELKGDQGSDRVIASNRVNTWQITANDGGILDKSIKLTGIENWIGGPSADVFVFAVGKALSGNVDGGGGPDTLDFSALTTAVTVNLNSASATGTKGFQNIRTIIGGKGLADKLIAPDLSNVWNLIGLNMGAVAGVNFQSMENLFGGLADDTFSLTSGTGVKGKIDGGGGLDALDYASFASPVTINLQTRTATSTGGFLNLEQFHASTVVGDTLIGANKVNTWALTGTGTGDIGGTSFANFENLTGGSLADAFTLAAGGDWIGTLNGAGGLDVLTAAPGINQWVSTGHYTGTLNGRKFLGIESRR